MLHSVKPPPSPEEPSLSRAEPLIAIFAVVRKRAAPWPARASARAEHEGDAAMLIGRTAEPRPRALTSAWKPGPGVWGRRHGAGGGVGAGGRPPQVSAGRGPVG